MKRQTLIRQRLIDHLKLYQAIGLDEVLALYLYRGRSRRGMPSGSKEVRKKVFEADEVKGYSIRFFFGCRNEPFSTTCC